jgi:hypothetical protein
METNYEPGFARSSYPGTVVRPSWFIQTTEALFGRTSGAASRAAPGEALPNICPEAIGGLHRQGEANRGFTRLTHQSNK